MKREPTETNFSLKKYIGNEDIGCLFFKWTIFLIGVYMILLVVGKILLDDKKIEINTQ
jgi:hypothetical protein